MSQLDDILESNFNFALQDQIKQNTVSVVPSKHLENTKQQIKKLNRDIDE